MRFFDGIRQLHSARCGSQKKHAHFGANVRWIGATVQV